MAFVYLGLSSFALSFALVPLVSDVVGSVFHQYHSVAAQILSVVGVGSAPQLFDMLLKTLQEDSHNDKCSSVNSENVRKDNVWGAKDRHADKCSIWLLKSYN